MLRQVFHQLQTIPIEDRNRWNVHFICTLSSLNPSNPLLVGMREMFVTPVPSLPVTKVLKRAAFFGTVLPVGGCLRLFPVKALTAPLMLPPLLDIVAVFPIFAGRAATTVTQKVN